GGGRGRGIRVVGRGGGSVPGIRRRRLRLQSLARAVGELAEELLRDLLDHAAAELRELPDELNLGLDADLGGAALAGRDAAGHGHARRARALRVLPLARHADAVVLLIHLRQLGLALVARGDRPDLDAHAAEEGALVLRLDQLGAGEALNDLVRVE